MNNKQVIYKTTPWPVLLSIIFMVLKLCNVITWSWWWVFAPIWIPFGLVTVLLLAIMIFAIIVLVFEPY